MFLREDELTDVVTEALVVDIGDGTGFNVGTGVGVEPEGDRLRLSASTVWPNRRSIGAIAPADGGRLVGC